MSDQKKNKRACAIGCSFELMVSALLLSIPVTACAQKDAGRGGDVPSDIRAVMEKPLYHGATWGMRVIDIESGRTLIDLNPDRHFFIASVRKVFTVGELMDKVGPWHRYNTPVYRQGKVNRQGILQGDLILVASGDLTMGGRTNPDGSIALGAFDHNEANSLGNADITKPDPLAGYRSLARQVAESGIKEITGDVVIDDRLFKPYEYRREFEMRPIFVNDDLVDASINPAAQGALASLHHRPVSEALAVVNEIEMTAPGTPAKIEPELPSCIGEPECSTTLIGTLPVGYKPPLTHRYPLLRTIRITQPSNYARTVFIEALRAAGVQVKAATVEPNPTDLLPTKDCYDAAAKVTELRALHYTDDAKFVMKVSYNIGADTSLLLWGLTEGAADMEAALAAEKRNLRKNYGVSHHDYTFLDGSGGGDSTATNEAVTHFLTEMYTHPDFAEYHASFPILGVDGSLATVTDFESDASLAPARGQVYAKTGTYVGASSNGTPELKAQALGGYVTTRQGRKLAFQLVVNGVPVDPEDLIGDVLKAFQDEGKISAILWRDY